MSAKRLSRRDAISFLGLAAAATAVGCTDGSETQTPEQEQENPPTGGESRADFSLQSSIEGLSVPEMVTVVGVGGFGAWPAYYAALVGVPRIVLWDPAITDAIDLARTPFYDRHIGAPKVEAMREVIADVRPSTDVQTNESFFSLEEHMDTISEGVVFDGVNDQEATQALSQAVRAKELRYATGFYNGLVVGASDEFVPGTSVRSGAQIPVWGAGAALSGLLAFHAALLAPFTFVGNPSNIGIPDEQVEAAMARIAGADK